MCGEITTGRSYNVLWGLLLVTQVLRWGFFQELLNFAVVGRHVCAGDIMVGVDIASARGVLLDRPSHRDLLVLATRPQQLIQLLLSLPVSRQSLIIRRIIRSVRRCARSVGGSRCGRGIGVQTSCVGVIRWGVGFVELVLSWLLKGCGGFVVHWRRRRGGGFALLVFYGHRGGSCDDL